MTHPSDPHARQGDPGQFGETQIGVPQFGSAPQPQQPPFQPPQYQRPQYQQGQYQPPQYQQGQHVQGQFQQLPQNGPFGQPHYGQAHYGQQFPSPPKSRTPLIVGLLALALAIAAVLTVVVVAPWKSAEPDEVTATFELDGMSVDVRLPPGWSAATDSEKNETLIRIHQNEEERVLSQLSDNLRGLDSSGSGSPMHIVVMFTGECTTTATSDDWATRNKDDSSTNHTERWMYASSKLDDRKCLNLSGVDSAADATAAGSVARDLLQQLITEDRVTAGKSV